ncbi:MAG TPA: MATE family efflux transporter [Prevotellaceae bacterium]|nr:MATE family efflux transporter [Prevotellaceae bacterium]
MSKSEEKNKRIAINTLFLYLRMLLLMVVSLYTSRIVLDALGVVDYGLYNVVGGIVVALGFLSGTLNTASSRFITVALSNGDMSEMKKTFSNVLFVNMMLALIILIAGETIGLWFLFNKMQIPTERFTAAFWVYQMSIVTVMINVMSSAFNACIIAHERMKTFAYISLIDAFGKLLLAFFLTHIINYDKLIIYGAFLLLIQIIDRLIYGMYCSKHFPETKTKITIDKPIIKKMFEFISWASYGSFVSIGFTQGLNILINIFFGPAINAARAVSVQVQNAVVSFTTNFQTAVNPQLIQSVVNKDFERSKHLLKMSSKYSFFLLCLIGIPLIAVTPYILNLWLKEVPEHTVWFVRLMLIINIWSCIANPLRIINQAEGNIRKFQLCEGTVLLLIVPISYIVLKFYTIPELVFLVHLAIELLSNYIRIKIVLPKINMSITYYFKYIYLPLLIVFSIAILLCVILTVYMGLGTNFSSTLLVCIILEILISILICLIGLNNSERKQIINIFKNMKSKFNK